MTTATEPTALYFLHTPTAPDLDHFDVKRVVRTKLLGRSATLTVIGESHCIGVQTLGFHELCSCKPLPTESMHRTPLNETVERSFSFENERCSAATTVETRPIDDCELPETDTDTDTNADAAYRFGPDAWTVIDTDSDGYETYHTYPECGLTLYTRTRLHSKPSIETTETDPVVRRSASDTPLVSNSKWNAKETN